MSSLMSDRYFFFLISEQKYTFLFHFRNNSKTGFTEQDIADLKRKATSLSILSYSYGNIRCNYVSERKRWKTTIFTETKEDCDFVLEKICMFLNEPFDRRCYTKRRETRPKLTAREIPLGDIGLNKVNYQMEFKVVLKRIVLMINNLEKPISILEVEG